MIRIKINFEKNKRHTCNYSCSVGWNLNFEPTIVRFVCWLLRMLRGKFGQRVSPQKDPGYKVAPPPPQEGRVKSICIYIGIFTKFMIEKSHDAAAYRRQSLKT